MSDDNVTPIRPGVRTNSAGTKRPGVKKGRKATPESGAKAIAAIDKQAVVLAMRRRGKTLQECADAAGYADAASAYNALQAALKTILPDATRDEARRAELDRLDALMAAHWTQATVGNIVIDGDGEVVEDRDGNPLRWGPDEKAAGVVLRCIAARAKLLGLEAPQQVSLTVREGEAVEVEILQALPPQVLATALELRRQMTDLAAMRAGAIEA